MSGAGGGTDGGGSGSREGVFSVAVREGVCRLGRPGTRWLSTGAHGGGSVADAAYNVTVPEGWPETDLREYVRERRERAGFGDPGPALLTGVEQRHGRRARLGPCDAVVTAGVSNPAALPVDPGPAGAGPADACRDVADVPGGPDGADGADHDGDVGRDPADGRDGGGPPPGTVNVVVGTARSLAPGALANLVAVAAEAKAATLLAATGFPGTTTDAVVAGCDPDGEPAAFSGSATEVGNAARVCVRDATLAALASRYAVGDRVPPPSVDGAEHGVVAEGDATVSTIR